ncbi:MAG: hypothetical protein IPP43_01455 [Chitinophagaceae bacterium]|nr:hypothetical protein [Chitinophagaceae bacterium]
MLLANPLANRQAWTGTSGAFITTTVNLPPASAGQPCQLKFRMGSDNSVSATGWRVDNFSVSATCLLRCSLYHYLPGKYYGEYRPRSTELRN